MKVILTEKPSVARDIAQVIGARSQKDGYLEGNGFQITWAFGHLVSLKEPEDYRAELKRWSLEPLPFVPQNFELKLIEDKGAKKQFRTIKKLFTAADSLICATDAGREGELIFRYILSLSGCTKKPFQRLWLSSLTEEAIKAGFQNLRPGSDFDRLYSAAKCRSEADWIVGLNATRNYTVRYGARGILWSVGRVQTPILSLIAARDDEIEHFKPEPFWELMTQYKKVSFKFKGDRFKKKEEAEAQLKTIEGKDFQIDKIQAKKEKVFPPLLYDLTELQRDMNKKHGISAADTLKYAQSLYESKLITYPRTDSRYLSQDMKAEVCNTLTQLQRVKPEAVAKLSLDKLSFNKRIINDKKVTDHHAILPTGKFPGNLPPQSSLVFDAIATRLIAVFYPPCEKLITTVEGSSNKLSFQAKGVQIVHPGWTVLYPKKTTKEEQELPSFEKGEKGPHKPYLHEGKTKPPLHFSENTLLGAMETAGKLVDDEQLKEALKEKGLGTPATRASIIETLLRRGYILRQKKKIQVTDLGRYLCALIQDPILKSAEMTGNWEAQLKEIEQGKLDSQTFMNKIARFTQNLIQHSDVSTYSEQFFGSCPLCNKNVIEGKRGYGCSGWKEGCSFVLWKKYKTLDISHPFAKRLIQKRILMQPFRFEGNAKSVVLYLSEKGQLCEVPLPEAKKFVPRKKARA